MAKSKKTYASIMQEANKLIALAKEQEQQDCLSLGKFVKNLVDTGKLDTDSIKNKYVELFGELPVVKTPVVNNISQNENNN